MGTFFNMWMIQLANISLRFHQYIFAHCIVATLATVTAEQVNFSVGMIHQLK